MRLFYIFLLLLLYQCSPISRSSLEKPKLKNGFEYYAASIDSLNADAYPSALVLVEEAILLNPNYAKFYLLQGDIYRKLQNVDSALKAYSQATKLRSGYVDALLRIAEIQEIAYKNYDEAIKYYRKSYSINTSDYFLLLNIGKCYLAKGEINLAKNKANEYKNLVDSENITPIFDYYFLNGRINFLLYDYKQAKIDFENAIKIQPDHFESKLSLIKCLFELEDLENGLKYTNELLKENDTNGNLYFFRGLYYFKKEKYNDALKLFNQALNFDDALVKSHYYLGKIYNFLDNKQKSLFHLQLYRKSIKEEEHLIKSP